MHIFKCVVPLQLNLGKQYYQPCKIMCQSNNFKMVTLLLFFEQSSTHPLFHHAALPLEQCFVSPLINGCTLVIGMAGLGATGGWVSADLDGSFSDWRSVTKLPRGLTFRVLGVSTVGRSSSVTETTSIFESSSCSGASA